MLRARRAASRRAADERDELAPSQLIVLRSIPPARAELQDIELQANSQRVLERLRNLSGIGRPLQCPSWVKGGGPMTLALGPVYPQLRL